MLTKVIAKMAKQVEVTWIPEKVAAELLNLKPRTVRKYVKWGKLKIAMTSANNGRRLQYNKVDIDKLLFSNSSIA
jgi:DNA-binding transcriptional MerR regulator